MPNITGNFGTVPNIYTQFANGAFSFTLREGNGVVAGNNGSSDIYFDASQSNAIYGKSNTVQPQAIKTFVLIKY